MKKKAKLNLPKGYLSWSQYNLWKRNPATYRKEYYYGVKREANQEMRYGDTVARMLESGAKGPVIDRIPRFDVSEHKIETEVNGVPVLAFIDSFDPVGFAFMEYKTGHLTPKGEVPWDKVKVRKHAQLVFYAASILAKHKKCNLLTQLIWIETEKVPLKEDFGGIEMESVREGKLKLTGRIDIFPRRIGKWEIYNFQKDLLKVAMEISGDYSKHQKEMLGK